MVPLRIHQFFESGMFSEEGNKCCKR
jgi:hypothetical protein